MNTLDINCFQLITSFLVPRETNILCICSKLNKEICKHFMTYSYDKYGNNEIYINMIKLF